MADLTNEELVKRMVDALDKIQPPKHIRCDPLMAEVLAICGQRDAARAEVERLLRLLPPTARGITNGPGEGSWSVFAEKVVEERDAARAEVERLRADLDEAMLLLGGENGKLPVSMRFPEYLDRCEKLRAKWMARRAKHKETP